MHSEQSLLETSLWIKDTLLQKKMGASLARLPILLTKDGFRKIYPIHIIFGFLCLFVSAPVILSMFRGLAFGCLIYKMLKRTLTLIPGILNHDQTQVAGKQKRIWELKRQHNIWVSLPVSKIMSRENFLSHKMSLQQLIWGEAETRRTQSWQSCIFIANYNILKFNCENNPTT